MAKVVKSSSKAKVSSKTPAVKVTKAPKKKKPVTQEEKDEMQEGGAATLDESDFPDVEEELGSGSNKYGATEDEDKVSDEDADDDTAVWGEDYGESSSIDDK